MYSFFINKLEIDSVDTIVIPLYSDSLQVDNLNLNKKLNRLVEREIFKGILGETNNVEFMLNDKVVDVVFLGLGNSKLLEKEKVRRAFGNLDKAIEKLKCKKVELQLSEVLINEEIEISELIKSLIEGLILSSYTFDKYIKNKKCNDIEIDIKVSSKENISYLLEVIKETANISYITHKVRDLVNEPSNVIYPETLANEAIIQGEKYGFNVEVIEEERIKELKMDAFLSVGQGSDKKPRFIIMRYFGDKKSEKKLGLVGKGLTYDSGGYSIKPSDAMVSMKADMGGAATVIGAMSSIAINKLKVNVIAVIPACENMISGNSYKPGDIINSMAGKTIEVVNVDAEGRLTIVDGITYIINNEKVDEVIDVATLTNTVRIALGEDVAAVICNNNKFYKEVEQAIEKTDEKIWRMPNYEDYKKLFKSDIADIKNYGSSYGKVISAGMFIGEFVQEKPWMHLDIAGPAFIDKEMEYCTKGGTGFGVRTLYELIKARSK